jgi:hypothetical protein
LVKRSVNVMNTNTTKHQHTTTTNTNNTNTTKLFEVGGWSRLCVCCRAASGEWEGCSATFSAEGQPKELPPYYVPDAYREWGQQLFDWQAGSISP